MTVIENGMPERAHAAPAPPPPVENGLVFGFFGQISALKGINVLIEAAGLLDRAGIDRVRIDVNGDYSGQPEVFRLDFEKRLAKAPENFRYRGPYENNRVDSLMQ